MNHLPVFQFPITSGRVSLTIVCNENIFIHSRTINSATTAFSVVILVRRLIHGHLVIAITRCPCLVMHQHCWWRREHEHIPNKAVQAKTCAHLLLYIPGFKSMSNKGRKIDFPELTCKFFVFFAFSGIEDFRAALGQVFTILTSL